MATSKAKERAMARDQEQQQRAPGDPAPLDLQPGVGGDGASVAELVGQLDGDPAGAAEADAAATTAEGPQDQSEVPGDEVPGDDAVTGDQDKPEGQPEGEAGDAGPEASGDSADGDAAGATTGKGKGRGRQPKAAADPKPPKQERVAKQPGLCVHGCGQMCQRPQAKFVRGHDSLLAQELRAAYANGERTAEQIREHAALISDKFLGKIERSIAAVDAERAATDDAARARKELIKESVKVAKARA